MGNRPTCVDCQKNVPIKVTLLDSLPFEAWGRRFEKWWSNEIWVLLKPRQYICGRCLHKRQNTEIEKEERRRRQQIQQEKEAQRRLEHQRERELREYEKLREIERQEEEQRQYERETKAENRRQRDIYNKSGGRGRFVRQQEEKRQLEIKSRSKKRTHEEEKGRGKQFKIYELLRERKLFTQKGNIVHESFKRQEGEFQQTQRLHRDKNQIKRNRHLVEQNVKTFQKQSETEDRNPHQLTLFKDEEKNSYLGKKGESGKTLQNQNKIDETNMQEFEHKKGGNLVDKSQSEQDKVVHERFQSWRKNRVPLIDEHSRQLQTKQFVIRREVGIDIEKFMSLQDKEYKTSFAQGNPAMYNAIKSDDELIAEMIDSNFIKQEDVETIRTLLTNVNLKINEYRDRLVFTVPSPNPAVIRKCCEVGSLKEICNHLLTNCIYEICLGVYSARAYWPRSTQIISLWLLIKAIQQGCLLEINTGEGKTCIIAMFSAFLAMSNISVDIVSSSPILAKRDYEEWQSFYLIYDITVSCNLIPTKQDERLRCYTSSIVYGTTGSFASDILRHSFLMENVRGDRKCEAVIVDEVDCLLLDQGVHFTYLSNTVPGMHHLEPVLFMIWGTILKHEQIQVSSNKSNVFLGNLEPIHLALSNLVTNTDSLADRDISNSLKWLQLFEKKGFIHIGIEDAIQNDEGFDFEDYRRELSIDKMLNCLQFVQEITSISFEIYVIDDASTIHPVSQMTPVNSLQTVKVLVVGEGLLCSLYDNKTFLCKSIKENIERNLSFNECAEKAHEMPSYLKEFVINRLLSWIDNAFIAKEMKQGRDYLVEDNSIVPVDFESTGVVQFDTKWGDCLHQFLEIKHGMKMSQITLVTNFMSNQQFFFRYERNIYGVSGTLGGANEKAFLDRQFDLQCKYVPTHRFKVFKEITGAICETEEDWYQTIENIVNMQTTKNLSRSERAVLLICEDINTAENFQERLKNAKCKSVFLYARHYEQHNEIEKTLKGGDIIVATNIAGRGTDIEIDESVQAAGGLFVLVSFLPQNTRVENQVFGRCARKGQPGNAQIVINKHDLPEDFQQCSKMHSLKALRDAIEDQRIRDIEKNTLTEVRLKEDLFSYYCSFLPEIKKFQFNETEEKIIFDSLHEHWGMWLKMNCDVHNNCNETNISDMLKRMLEEAKKKVIQKISPCRNIFHFIKFANEKMTDRNYEEAISLFSKAIKTDKKWAAIAYYNRAYCRLRLCQNNCIQDALKDLMSAKQSFELFKQEIVLCLSLLSQASCQGKDQEMSLRNQFNIRCQILQYVNDNIESTNNQLRNFQKTGKKAAVDLNSIFIIALADEHTSKKIGSELYLFWELGLTDIISVTEKKLFSYKGLLVALLGIVQIAVGTVIIASTTGLLIHLGWGFIGEGVHDICKGAYAFLKGEQNFLKSWMFSKIIRIALSVLSLGFSHVKNAAKGATGIKDGIQKFIGTIKEDAKNVFVELKTIPNNLAAKSFQPVFKKTCEIVAKDVGSKLADKTKQYLLQVVRETIQSEFKSVSRELLYRELQLALTKGDLQITINRFIVFQHRTNQAPSDISETFMDITKKLLNPWSIKPLRQLLFGCVKSVLRETKSKLELKKLPFFGQCKEIFDIFDNIPCSTYDVKHLVAEYTKHVKMTLQKIYGDEQEPGNKKDIKIPPVVFVTTKQKMLDATTNYLFDLLQNSFELTCSGDLSDKMQRAVGHLVQEYCPSSGETINKILSISLKVKNHLVEDNLKIDLPNIGKTGLKITGDEIIDATITNKHAKVGVKIGFDVGKKASKALVTGKSDEFIGAMSNLPTKFTDRYIDGDIAKIGFDVGKKASKALVTGKSDEFIGAMSNLPTEFTDRYIDGDIAKIGFDVGKKASKALVTGKSDEFIGAMSNLPTEFTDRYIDGDIAKIGIDVGKKVCKALVTGKSDEFIGAMSNLPTEFTDRYIDGDIAKIGIDVGKKVCKAAVSGKSDQLVGAVKIFSTDLADQLIEVDTAKTDFDV